MMQRGVSRLFLSASLLLFLCGGAYIFATRKAPPAAPPSAASAQPATFPATPVSAAAPDGAVPPASSPRDAGPAPGQQGRKKPARRWKISGKVVQTSEYCGGANPSGEILEALRKEKPFPNKQLFVRTGTVNKVAKPILQSFTTDAEGHFEISLPPGDYCVIEEHKKNQLKIPDFTKENEKLPASDAYRLTSEDCLRVWWKACDKTLRVKRASLKGVVIRFHLECHPPCVTGGPPPI